MGLFVTGEISYIIMTMLHVGMVLPVCSSLKEDEDVHVQGIIYFKIFT